MRVSLCKCLSRHWIQKLCLWDFKVELISFIFSLFPPVSVGRLTCVCVCEREKDKLLVFVTQRKLAYRINISFHVFVELLLMFVYQTCGKASLSFTCFHMLYFCLWPLAPVSSFRRRSCSDFFFLGGGGLFRLCADFISVLYKRSISSQ